MAELKTETSPQPSNNHQTLVVLGIVFASLVLLMLAYISLRVTLAGRPGLGNRPAMQQMQRRMQTRRLQPQAVPGGQSTQPQPAQPNAQTQSVDDLNFNEESALN